MVWGKEIKTLSSPENSETQKKESENIIEEKNPLICLELTLKTEENGIFYLKLLRESSWLETNQVQVGSQFTILLPESKIQGIATITKIYSAVQTLKKKQNTK